MRASTSASQARGSMSLSLAVIMSEYIAAARSPPRSLPANNQALRPSATPRKPRSAALFVRQIRPSSRKRVKASVLPALTSCPCCGGKLVKLGEAVTETLESILRRYKVIQTVREKFSAARARRSHNRWRHSIRSSVAVQGPTCWRRSCMPNSESISGSTAKASGLPARASILAYLRWPIGWVPARRRCRRGKTITGRLWIYVRDDRPFGGPS